MLRPNLDLRRLRYFRAIAQAGSISAAARSLNISQPALTHHMSDLEEGLGLALFARSVKGIRLTAAGTTLLRRTETILEEVESTERELAAIAARSGRKQSLSLALISSLAPRLTPAVLEAVAREMPNTLLQVLDGRTNQSRQLIAAGQLDLAVVIADPARSNGVPLFWESLFLISLPAANRRERILPRDLSGERLIIPARTNPLREFIELAARDAGVTLDVVAEVSGIDARKRAVMAGIGSTLLPYHTVARECETGELQAIPFGESVRTRLVVLEHRAELDPATVSAMRDILVPLLAQVFEDGAQS